MTVGRLKELLAEIPNEYEIELGIGEEGDLLRHIFIDNDFGYIELSNFVDSNYTSDYVDMFKNHLKEGDKIIFIDTNEDGSHVLRRGKIKEFNPIDGTNRDFDLIEIEIDETGEIAELYKSENKKIMLYNW